MGNKDFWQDHCAIVLANGVPEAKAEWFVKWAQQFERFVNTDRDLPTLCLTCQDVG